MWNSVSLVFRRWFAQLRLAHRPSFPRLQPPLCLRPLSEGWILPVSRPGLTQQLLGPWFLETGSAPMQGRVCACFSEESNRNMGRCERGLAPLRQSSTGTDVWKEIECTEGKDGGVVKVAQDLRSSIVRVSNPVGLHAKSSFQDSLALMIVDYRVRGLRQAETKWWGRLHSAPQLVRASTANAAEAHVQRIAYIYYVSVPGMYSDTCLQATVNGTLVGIISHVSREAVACISITIPGPGYKARH